MKIVPGDDLDQMVKEEIEKDTSGKYSAYKVDRLTAFLYYLLKKSKQGWVLIFPS